MLSYQSNKGTAMATMKRLLEEFVRPADQPGEYLNPDELEIVLEALTWYRNDPIGRKSAGRATWIREKLLRARSEGSTITLIGS